MQANWRSAKLGFQIHFLSASPASDFNMGLYNNLNLKGVEDLFRPYFPTPSASGITHVHKSLFYFLFFSLHYNVPSQCPLLFVFLFSCAVT